MRRISGRKKNNLIQNCFRKKPQSRSIALLERTQNRVLQPQLCRIGGFLKFSSHRRQSSDLVQLKRPQQKGLQATSFKQLAPPPKRTSRMRSPTGVSDGWGGNLPPRPGSSRGSTFGNVGESKMGGTRPASTSRLGEWQRPRLHH